MFPMLLFNNKSLFTDEPNPTQPRSTLSLSRKLINPDCLTSSPPSVSFKINTGPLDSIVANLLHEDWYLQH